MKKKNKKKYIIIYIYKMNYDKENNNIQTQLQYGLKVGKTSHYKINKFSPVSGNLSSFTTSTQTTTFEIAGQNVYNFSKMYINFERGAIAASGPNTYNFVVNSYIPYIDRVILKTQNGTIINDVSNIDIYSRLSMPLLNNFKENTQLNSALYPTDSIVTQTANTNLQGCDPFIDNKQTAISPAATDLSMSANTILRYSNYDTAPTNSILPAKNINIQLCDLLRDSIFEVDKSLWIGRNLYLTITWRSYKNWLYIPTNPTGPDAFGMLNTDKAITCNNLQLITYNEANPFMVEQIKAKQAEKNFSIVIPDLKDNNIVIGNAAGDRSVLVKVLNPGNAMLYSFYSGLVSGNVANFYTTNNTSNYANAKYSDIKFFLNNLQLGDLSATTNQDLEHMLQFYKNHSYSDLPSFKVSSPFSHIFDCSSRTEKLWDGQTINGIPFDNPQGEHSLMITYKLNAPGTVKLNNPDNQSSFNCFVFSVVLKQLFLNDQGDIQLMPFN